METKPNKLTANDTIISMLIHINSDRKDLFYKCVEDYASTLAFSGNYYRRV